MTYLKITNAEENHHELQYHDGLNIDPIPFKKEGSCVPGGIYFTTPEYICEFIWIGVYVREVTIPEDAEMVQDPRGNKWRASKVMLGERRDLREVSTWEYLIYVGVDIRVSGFLALRYVVKNGCLEVLKYLKSVGIDVLAKDNESLIVASYNGHLEVVKYLVSIGANIHENNDDALRYASANGHLEVVRYLVSVGADVHAKNDEAIIFASECGHLEVVKCLVSVGADIHSVDDLPLKVASRNGCLDVVKYLKDHANI